MEPWDNELDYVQFWWTKTHPSKIKHKVVKDYVGFRATLRLTCMSHNCDAYRIGETLVCWGWVSEERFNDFIERHPHTKMVNEGYRG